MVPNTKIQGFHKNFARITRFQLKAVGAARS